MKQELEQEIIAIASYMFVGRNKPITENLMAFGMMYGDGWFELTKKMVMELKKVDEIGDIYFVEMKEKYGVLVVYYYLRSGGNCDERFEKIIDKYSKISSKTCEVCGKKGKLNKKGYWISCRCKKCRLDDGVHNV